MSNPIMSQAGLLNESKAIQWQITFCCHCTKNPSATGIARKLLRRWGQEQEKAHPHLTFAWRRCTSKSHTMSVQFNRFSSCSKCHPEDARFARFQLILNTFQYLCSNHTDKNPQATIILKLAFKFHFRLAILLA